MPGEVKIFEESVRISAEEIAKDILGYESDVQYDVSESFASDVGRIVSIIKWHMGEACNRRTPEPGTSVIRWTRYNGSKETLPEVGDRVLLVRVNQRKFRPDIYEFEIHDGVNKWNDFIDRFNVRVGDCWALLPEPPEGME